MRRSLMIMAPLLVTLTTGIAFGHDLSEHMSGECEFIQSEVNFEELLASLQKGQEPCILVTMTPLASDKRVFLIQEGGQLICENEFEPTTRRSVIPNSVRHLHISHLHKSSELKDGELIVRSCGLAHVE
ncbi:hypothetical protein NBRC116590_17160 [Pelagimonas sp. KU-00592-HH]